MISKYVKEQQRYTQDEIREILECNTDDTVRIIRKLKEFGVLKNVKKNDNQSMLSDLIEEDVQVTDIENGERELYYVFSFVGVIVVYGRILKCYPKYISSKQEPIAEMKQILRVLEKYNAKEQIIKLFNTNEDEGSFNLLAVMLFLLQDYYENGVYANDLNIIETNGNGEILWHKTINETFSYISDDRPYYIELQTIKRVSDEYDFFRRLHESILTIFSKELEQSDLPDLFNISTVELSEEVLEDFGDEDYILYRIQNELNVQYNTRKQMVLKALYAYVAQKVSFDDIESFSMYGSNSFNLVWEKVCAENFGSVLDKKLSELPPRLSEEYESLKNKKLKEIIDKPQWFKYKPYLIGEEVETLKPDLICIYTCVDDKYCFGIYDAKYYCIDFKEQNGKYKVTGQPGVGDITKQYLYQLAYDDFIIKQGYEYVQNMFFCPQESAEPDYGYVEMKMLHTIGDKMLENIAVVKLCATEMYDIYLQNEKIKDPTEYIPSAAVKRVHSTNFSNRMMAYLRGITKASQEAQIKLEMKSDKGKLIYPRQIKREIGAKLIYDALCPIATGAFYGFDPYERDYENMVAEDMGNSYEKCELIAEVALEIEKKIKMLSEGELQDEGIVKDALQHCFDDKKEISAIAKGNSLNQLVEKVMELIRELYL